MIDEFCQRVLYSGIWPIQGIELLESNATPQRLSTGFTKLDEVLQGGLLQGSITEFAGPSNTCKTMVTLDSRFSLTCTYLVMFAYHTIQTQFYS